MRPAGNSPLRGKAEGGDLGAPPVAVGAPPVAVGARPVAACQRRRCPPGRVVSDTTGRDASLFPPSFVSRDPPVPSISISHACIHPPTFRLAGKSTTCGHLIFKQGGISAREMEKLQQMAEEKARKLAAHPALLRRMNFERSAVATGGFES